METGEPRWPKGLSREVSQYVFCRWHSYSGSSKGEVRLEECAVHARIRRQPLEIAVFALKTRIVRDVVPHANDGLDQILIREELFAERRVRMFEAIVGLQSLFKPRQPVAHLHVVCLVIGDSISQNILVIDVCEFRQEFRSLLGPNNMRGGNPFAKFISGRVDRQSDFVAIDGDSHLQPIELCGPRIKVGDPRTIVIVVARVPGTANGEPASIADACVIAEPCSPRRNISLSQNTQNVHGDKRPAKLDHLSPPDRGLQPGAVMERGVPIGDGRVVPSDVYYAKDVVVVSTDGAFNFQGVARR